MAAGLRFDRCQLSKGPTCGDDLRMATCEMSKALETDRLILRCRNVDEAGVYRRLWMERDPRVPTHRRIDAEGRPTVEDIASEIRREREEPRPGVFAVERKSAGDVIGYCGLVFHGNGAPDEPELAYELLRRAHGVGYARRVEPWSLGQPRRATSGCGQLSARGMSPLAVFWRSLDSTKRARSMPTPLMATVC